MRTIAQFYTYSLLYTKNNKNVVSDKRTYSGPASSLVNDQFQYQLQKLGIEGKNRKGGIVVQPVQVIDRYG